MNLQRSKTILLADDDPDDVLLTKLACERSGIAHSMAVVGDGAKAIDYLAGNGEYSDRQTYPLPGLILLDVKMPKLDGLDVLAWIRTQPQFANIPIIMLTNSNEPKDVDRAYRLKVTSYLLKGAKMADFEQAMRVVLKYWLEMNVLP